MKQAAGTSERYTISKVPLHSQAAKSDLREAPLHFNSVTVILWELPLLHKKTLLQWRTGGTEIVLHFMNASVS